MQNRQQNRCKRILQVSAEEKTAEKRKQRLLPLFVISHRKLQGYCLFQVKLNWSCHNHPVLHKDMPIKYQQNLISNKLLFNKFFKHFSTTSSISRSCYRFFDTSKRFKRLVSRGYSSTTDAKNSCTNPAAKVFTKSKSNKLSYLPKPSSEFVCHCHT